MNRLLERLFPRLFPAEVLPAPPCDAERLYNYEGHQYLARNAHAALCQAYRRAGPRWRQLPVEVVYVAATNEAVQVATTYDDKKKTMTATTLHPEVLS